ncbi:Inner membrane transport protein YdhC [Lentilactobacillus parabuchneri]|jgi:DHA1 family bicyclomycin/chloramphenicol resistance-like MFS transporter|uniref:Inner membrane transport protein YdhC n=2 Tax=Lentilactobacillus parabuchneri TaxID=152331 RepID=A0A1X1FF37_9LACO|nr:MFS transporter [Lentilactobacillus parabuchneri]APR07274.1 Inner membrane transport protein YdhC [Lentilactobacillus parabuchneri]KRM47372.1 major facilitator superfamily protein [Lentilactobacillus parabuchneri DSM 5707 = NBRC 107865]KRN79941.1 major facilitator superfamily protein [Lentilactobacillus parabuchneri]MBW0223008.1 MFS transporter [Lentilactobacillus parabuchneri]MBW0245317.1 MFS transporter [Lentilactobacillus parabuchneri]
MATNQVQPRMGNTGFIVFLALLSAFVPLSTDLYLPALPEMTKFFAVPEIVMNLTLILFFVFYSIATLFWGPLSDRYGRRPILLIGLTLYMVASILCGIATNAYEIIIFRVLQAIGGGVATTIATAVIKDVFVGRKQETTLAIVQSMVVISPAIAPVIGSLLLTFISWRGIFFAQALLGASVIYGALIFKETHQANHETTSVLRSFGRLGVLLLNPGFTALLFSFSLMSIVSLSYISSSSYIFQDTFHLSSRMFSLFFSFNAIGMLMGPLVYIPLSKYVDRFTIIYTAFGMSIVAGILVLSFGKMSPIAFALTQFPATLASSMVRPPGTYLVLKQEENDNGSASALYSAGGTIMGSIGMVIVSVAEATPVTAIAWINIVIGAACALLLWASMRFLKDKIRV